MGNYGAARKEILEGSRCPYDTAQDPDSKHYIRVYPPAAHGAGRSSEEKAARLLELEDRPETKKMRAVEWAMERVGTDLPEPLRKKLLTGILLNCSNRRSYPFEYLDVQGVGKTDFYARRTTFLADVATYLGYL